MFQSTRPRGARLRAPYLPNRIARVSIHAPARGATLVRLLPVGHGHVSIHAPARGATRRAAGRSGDEHGVSIHAPARGATWRPSRACAWTSSFNPRAREGRDPHHLASELVPHVSIHAPARGATFSTSCASAPPLLFQSTRPRGARPHRRAFSCVSKRFQSTRPRGARRAPAVSKSEATEFQSTRPRGARHLGALDDVRRHRVSIHAPARGATCVARDMGFGEAVFQSTRPRGARPRGRLHRGPRCCRFNPRAREGRDISSHSASPSLRVSIHAPARGAT